MGNYRNFTLTTYFVAHGTANVTREELEKQLKKTDCIVKVSEKIIENGELAFKAIQHKDKYYGTGGKQLPPMLEGEW